MSWPPWLGSGLALHPVAEMGVLITLEKKQIIRTHFLSETSSDYIGLVQMVGLEPTRPCEH